MNCDYVLKYLEKMEVPIVSKKNQDIIMCGLEKMIFLKEGVVKVSSILEDGREYNITYAKGPNLLSLMSDTLREDVAYRIRIRVESEQAELYCISKEDFYKEVKEDAKLQNYVNTYYRNQLKLAFTREQVIIMNSKLGVVCSWLYLLASLFGIQTQKAIFIDLQVTNEDIANFCGITTRNSVNRVIRGLKEKHIIQIKNNRLAVKNTMF